MVACANPDTALAQLHDRDFARPNEPAAGRFREGIQSAPISERENPLDGRGRFSALTVGFCGLLLPALGFAYCHSYLLQ
jgi:hypothetical protein